MIGTFEEDFFEEEPVIVGRQVKVALEVLGRNKSPRVRGILIELFQATETKAVKILTSMSTNVENKKTVGKHSLYISISKKEDAGEYGN